MIVREGLSGESFVFCSGWLLDFVPPSLRAEHTTNDKLENNESQTKHKSIRRESYPNHNPRCSFESRPSVAVEESMDEKAWKAKKTTGNRVPS